MTVPREQIAVKMDVLSYLDVRSDEVVQSVSCTRNVGAAAERWLLGVETFDRIRIGNALPPGHGTPIALISQTSKRCQEWIVLTILS